MPTEYGTVGDSFDNALAETVNGYQGRADPRPGPHGPHGPHGPCKTVEEAELTTVRWVHWHNTQRLHGYLDDLPPVEFEWRFYATRQTDQVLAH